MRDGTHLFESVDAGSLTLLRKCGQVAVERGGTSWLVGGMVRDLVRGVASPDLDVVVEGRGLDVAQALSRAIGGTLTRYPWFQTARIDAPDGTRIDVATARSEQYLRPGHLPRVTTGRLRDDLERRDFTINTLALCLDPERWGALLDPFDGRRDIADGVIRVLHGRSFADDPTRILRAIRFSQRFGYSLAPETSDLLQEAMLGNYFETISGDRLRREVLALFEECPVEGPAALESFEVLGAIARGLSSDPEPLRALVAETSQLHATGPDEVVEAIPLRGALVLAATAADLTQQQRFALARRLRLTRTQRDAVVETGVAWSKARGEWLAARETRTLSASESTKIFAGLGLGAGLVATALAITEGEEDLAEALRDVLARARWVRPALGGDDLMALGCGPGPAMGVVLATLRAARIDGEVSSIEQERRLAKRILDESARCEPVDETPGPAKSQPN